MVSMRATSRVAAVAGTSGASHAKQTVVQIALTAFSVSALVDTREQLVVGTATGTPATFGDFDATPRTITLGGADIVNYNTDNQTASIILSLDNGVNWGTVGHHLYVAYFAKTDSIVSGDAPDAVVDVGVLAA